MSQISSEWDLDEVEMAESAKSAALNVVERLTRRRDEATAQWETAIRLAKSNGASLRDIARQAGTSAQTVANICNRG